MTFRCWTPSISRDRFDAVGGLTLGADALAVGIARWFVVRKEAKGTTMVTHAVPLTEAAQGFRNLEEGSAIRSVVVPD